MEVGDLSASLEAVVTTGFNDENPLENPLNPEKAILTDANVMILL
jgi:hypothetical protein